MSQIQPYHPPAPPKSAGAYVILGIFLGPLGVHRFYAGDQRGGAIMLVLWFLALATFIVGVGIVIWLCLAGWSVIDLIRTNEILYADRAPETPVGSAEGWGEGWAK